MLGTRTVSPTKQPERQFGASQRPAIWRATAEGRRAYSHPVGVTTYWFGGVVVEPHLGQHETSLLDELSEGIRTIPGAPAGRCGWVASPDGSSLVWDRGEKFNDGAEWLRLLLGGELASHRASGAVVGFCSSEADVVEATRIVVEDSTVRSHAYEIPIIESDDLDEDEGGLGDVMYLISGLDGAEPDYQAASEALERFLSIVPLSDLGDFERCMADVLALLGQPEPLTTTFESHRR